MKAPRAVTPSQIARALKGKRIARVTNRRFRDGRGGWAYDPTVYFDDGSVLRFVVAETDSGAYGVDLVYAKRMVRIGG